MKSALIWDPDFTTYRFRHDHPFDPKRLELTISLIESLGLLNEEHRMIIPRASTEDELLWVHTHAYIDVVKAASTEAGLSPHELWKWGLGTDDTPVFLNMHEIGTRVVGGTLTAAELVMGGEVQRAFAIAGGLHHAHRDRASGFCIYSDLAVAIEWIRRKHQARVMYVDFDAHHGDGVQGIYYSDPEVLTLSIHESGRYLFPGTGFIDELGDGDGYGYSLNLPMEPFTEDGSWIDAYNRVLPEVAEAFRPDVIVLQAGCDAHALDPLTHLRCTTKAYEEMMRITCEVADSVCGGRIVATGGGGYAVWSAVPRAWSLVWAALGGQEVPDGVPMDWIQRWQGESPELLPERVRDVAGAYPEVPRRAEVAAMNARTVESLRRAALPLLRGWSMHF